MQNLSFYTGKMTDEQQVARQEQMECVERLIQSCAVPTFVIDSRHRVVLWNRACEALTGVNAADIIGSDDLGKVFYGFKRPVLADFVIDGNIEDVCNSYEVHAHSLLIPDGLQAEMWYTDQNGVERYIFFDAAPIRNNGGETIAAIETLQDITDRKRAEEKLQRIAADLKESNDDIRSFAYIVSHDLRAPLVNLKGFSGELELALKELAPLFERGLSMMDGEERSRMEELFRNEVPEALEFIGSSVDRMDRLINGILKLSRLGIHPLKKEPVDMNGLANSILKSLAHQLEKRNTTVIVGCLPEVVADRTAMEQIVGNLLDNAVKYLATDRPGRIEIEAETSPEMTVFHIHDNGRGIAEADQERIFEIFRRAGRQDLPGEGVGLAYVKALVRRQGGKIWCVSRQGEGSTFSFSIPRLSEVKEPPAAGDIKGNKGERR
jgi:signal transduction histidine kinase